MLYFCFMRTCTTCKQEKENEEFFFKNKSTGRRHAICKTCKRNVDKEHYQNSEQRRKKMRINALESIKRAKEFVDRVKKIATCRCGEKRFYVLEFHHIHSKDQNISELVKRGSSISRIKGEIRKCIILCANCHRETHYMEKKLTG